MGTTLWAWNGTDVAQFDSSPALLEGDGGARSPSFTLSTVAVSDAPTGQVLRVTYDALDLTGPTLAAAWLVTDQIDTTAYPTLIFKLQIRNVDTDSSTVSSGPLVGGLVSSVLYGYGLCLTSAQDAGLRIEAGSHVYDNSITTDGSADDSIGQQWEVRYTLDKPAAAEPRVLMYGRGRRSNSTSSPDMGQAVIQHTDLPSRPVSSTWNSVTMNRVGLCLRRDAGFGGGSFTLDIDDFRVETP